MLEQHELPPLGTRILSYRGHNMGEDVGGFVDQVVWSPDGTRIASCGSGDNAQIWGAQNGVCYVTYREADEISIYSLAWSSDSQYIVLGIASSCMAVKEISSGKELFRYVYLPFGMKLYITWSPDGAYLAVGARDGTVHICDAHTGRLITILRDHQGPIYTLKWSPDGMRLAAGGENQTVTIWDRQGKVVLTYQSDREVRTLSWSPDGTRIVSGGSSEKGIAPVQVWDSRTGEPVLTYLGHSYSPDGVIVVAWSPDGKRIASGCSGKSNDLLHLWDAATGEHLYSYRGHQDRVTALDWSPDSTRIVSAGTDNTLDVWWAV